MDHVDRLGVSEKSGLHNCYDYSNLVTPFKFCNPGSASAIAQQLMHLNAGHLISFFRKKDFWKFYLEMWEGPVHSKFVTHHSKYAIANALIPCFKIEFSEVYLEMLDDPAQFVIQALPWRTANALISFLMISSAILYYDTAIYSDRLFILCYPALPSLFTGHMVHDQVLPI
jgi:hypothetical protein